MKNKERAAWLRAKKCNMFAEDTRCDVNNIPERFFGTERVVSTVTMGITLNTVLEGLAREIEAIPDDTGSFVPVPEQITEE